jgi:hypothetical protein
MEMEGTGHGGQPARTTLPTMPHIVDGCQSTICGISQVATPFKGGSVARSTSKATRRGWHAVPPPSPPSTCTRRPHSGLQNVYLRSNRLVALPSRRDIGTVDTATRGGRGDEGRHRPQLRASAPTYTSCEYRTRCRRYRRQTRDSCSPASSPGSHRFRSG